MENLPRELYEKIANNISSKELLNFILTCKKYIIMPVVCCSM